MNDSVLDNVVKVLKNNFYLIENNVSFKAAYLIGSSLQFNSPEDLDIMLIYDDPAKYKDDIQYFPHYESRCNQMVNFCIKRFDYLIRDKYESLDDLFDDFFIKVAENSTKLIPLFIMDDSYAKDLSKYNLVTNIKYRNDVVTYIYNQFLKHNDYNLLKTEINNKKISNSMDDSYFKKQHRLLATCYILYNNSYEFTDEQKRILNKVHDSKEMSEELFDWCKSLITNLYKKE